MTEAAGGARRYGLGALAHRNFRLFFIGQGISLVGTWMENVGEGWLILTLTNSPFYVGLTAALSSLGVLLFSLYAGVIADRVDKRRVIILMQIAFMLEAFTVSILVWTGVIAVWQVLILATILGIASAFDIPMRQSFIVDGRQGRPDERDRAELLAVQRRACHRPGDRGTPDRRGRHRLVLLL